MAAVLFIAVAGFLGAASRYGISLIVPGGGGSSFPWSTLLINLSGSFLLGLLFGRAARRLIAAWLKEALGTGFLGAFTTFSAFNAELWELAAHEAYGLAAVYVLASGLIGWLLAAGGWSLGRGRSA